MNKNYLVATVTAALFVYSASSLADNTHGNRYMGVNFGFLDYEDDGMSGDASVSTIEGRVGGFFNDYVAGELRAGLGVTGDETTISGTKVDIDVNYLFGGYFRIGAPVTDKIFPYALLGYTKAEVEASGGGVSVDASETDTSFGVGVDVQISNMSLNFEYASLLDKKGGEISGFSVGFVTNF